MTKAAIHHHFPTKAALSLSVVERYAEAFLAELDGLNGPGALDAFVGLYREAADGGTRLCLCVSYASAPDSLSPEVRAAVAAFHADVTGWLSQQLTAANRDPAVWNAPNTFDPTRPIVTNTSFGGGLHFCVGAPLARLEMRIALQVLFQRVRFQ